MSHFEAYVSRLRGVHCWAVLIAGAEVRLILTPNVELTGDARLYRAASG